MTSLARLRTRHTAIALLVGLLGSLIAVVGTARPARADNIAPVDVRYDSAGNRYEAGWLYGTVTLGPGPGQTISGKNGIYVASWTPSNTLRWAHSINAAFASSYGGFAVTPGGRATLFGSGMAPIKISTVYTPRTLNGFGNTDLFLISFDGSDGHIVSARTEGGPGAESAFGLTTDGFNNLYAVGSFTQTATFGTAPTTTTLTSAGASEGLTVSYTSNGSLRWAVANSHGPNFSDTRAVLLAGGALYVAGTWVGQTTLGTVTVQATGTGGQDVYLERLDTTSGAAVWQRLARRLPGNVPDVYVSGLTLGGGQVKLAGYTRSTIGFSAPGGGVVGTFAGAPTTATPFVASYATNGWFLGVVPG